MVLECYYMAYSRNTGQHGFASSIWRGGDTDISTARHRQRTTKMQAVLWDAALCSVSGRYWPHVWQTNLASPPLGRRDSAPSSQKIPSS
jgi:hypothetical protein